MAQQMVDLLFWTVGNIIYFTIFEKKLEKMEINYYKQILRVFLFGLILWKAYPLGVFIWKGMLQFLFY
ncbi:MAG: hypothetical protein ACOCQR_00400 [bacterium]